MNITIQDIWCGSVIVVWSGNTRIEETLNENDTDKLRLEFIQLAYRLSTVSDKNFIKDVIRLCHINKDDVLRAIVESEVRDE